MRPSSECFYVGGRSIGAGTTQETECGELFVTRIHHIFDVVPSPLTREAPGDDGGLHQRPLPALLTAYPFMPAQITTTCTMRPLGKAARWPPARPLTALARASTAAFGRVVGDAAPGRPTRLDSHPGGVRLGQKPGGNGYTAYSAGDRRTRLGRSAAVGSVETPAARPSPPSGTSLDAHQEKHDSSSINSEDCCAKRRALRSKTQGVL